ncbi:sensor histidine kinase [Streptomyces phytohabitans]|uniref:sensor histidine kinase n=1 Tax=Streptomyces phytohabitans TaxID=1150371 RepID=UPI00345BD6A8
MTAPARSPALLGRLRHLADRAWSRTGVTAPPPLPSLAVDLAPVLLVGLLTGADAAVNEPGYRQADRFTWSLLAVSLLALAVRRRHPVLAALVTGAACAGWALYGHIGELLNLPVIVALYTVAVSGDRRRTLWTALVAASLSGAVALRVGRDVVNPQGLPVLEMLWPLVPLLLGEVVRTRGQLLDEYARRVAQAEAEREREAARRVREERVRIARELHDIVAHTVTAMTVHSAVALDALDGSPEVARRAMVQVRDSGREAVRELRATVGVLREDADETTAPAPRLAELGELVARLTGSGVEAVLRQPDDVGPLAPITELAAYRIVQEALTNVVRHARARHVAVSVRREGGDLVVEVVDDGTAAAPATSARAEHGTGAGPGTATGFGLVGMRERAAAVGGTLACGPAPGGGFRVRASLPADGGAP